MAFISFLSPKMSICNNNNNKKRVRKFCQVFFSVFHFFEKKLAAKVQLPSKMRVARGLSLSRRALHSCCDPCRSRGSIRIAGSGPCSTGKAASTMEPSPLARRGNSPLSSSSPPPSRNHRSLASAAALPPPTSEAQPWPELGDLRDMYNSVGARTRVRQHANPLRADLQVRKTREKAGFSSPFLFSFLFLLSLSLSL